MLTLPKKGDKTGFLRFLEFEKLSFNPQRIFWVSGVPKGAVRGGHGHYSDQQQLFCIKGEVVVVLVSASGEREFILKEGDSCFMDKMVWAQQTYLTGQDILLVLCSTKFDAEDYFYNREEVFNEKFMHNC
jgi:dTDP-4-dehydrorhamnose 3,5-epimerase-like enzyme